jgi:hypothetical protein
LVVLDHLPAVNGAKIGGVKERTAHLVLQYCPCWRHWAGCGR